MSANNTDNDASGFEESDDGHDTHSLDEPKISQETKNNSNSVENRALLISKTENWFNAITAEAKREGDNGNITSIRRAGSHECLSLSAEFEDYVSSYGEEKASAVCTTELNRLLTTLPRTSSDEKTVYNNIQQQIPILMDFLIPRNNDDDPGIIY